MRQKRYDSDLTDSQWERLSRYFATDLDTPPAKAGRFLGGSARPLTGQRSDLMELSLRQRSSSHRITQSGFRFAGSAMMPATRVAPRYFLFAVWRLWYGPSFEVPCRSNCSGRGREGLPPHCRLSRKTLQTLISIGSVSLRSTRRVPEPTGSYVPRSDSSIKHGTFTALLVLYSIL